MKEQYITTSLIMKDYISFKSECRCMDHDLRVTFEKGVLNHVSLTFEDKIYIIEQYNISFLKRLWSRIKIVFKILFKGYCEFDYQFIFKDKNHVDEFMKYMNDSYDEIKKEIKDEDQK